MRSERTCSKVAARRALKIRSMIHSRVGSLDVDLKAHVLQVLRNLPLPKDVVLDNYTCRGKMWKKGAIHRNWTLRYFVFDLRERHLQYFTDESMSVLKGSFMLTDVQSVARSKNEDYPYLMDIATSDRVYHFRTEDEYTLNVWLTVFDSIAPLDDAPAT